MSARMVGLEVAMSTNTGEHAYRARVLANDAETGRAICDFFDVLQAADLMTATEWRALAAAARGLLAGPR